MSDRDKRATEIANALEQKIRLELQPGDKLPTHRQMVVLFNASSQTIWYAMEKVKARGLVDTKRGVGVYVKKRS
jgi:DNA-binding GntR family transcriptional regulator